MTKPKTFRKRPVVVEAMLLETHTIDEVGVWCDGIVCEESKDEGPCIGIETLEGLMMAEIGDWIIKGVKGEFYPCEPHIFEVTYAEVT